MMEQTNMKTRNPKAVIDRHVSGSAQVKRGDGLGSQETRCREYAQHKGYNVLEVFNDEGTSGGMIDRQAEKYSTASRT